MERPPSTLDKVPLGASRAVLAALPMTERCLPMNQVNSEPEKNTHPQETHLCIAKPTFHAPKEKEGSYFCYMEEWGGSTLNLTWDAFFLVTSPINVPGIHEVVSGFPRTWGNQCCPIWMEWLYHFTPRLETCLSQEVWSWVRLSILNGILEPFTNPWGYISIQLNSWRETRR